MIVVNGFNTISREAAHNLLGDKQTEGIFAGGSMEIAEFLGFSRQQGLGTYKAVTLFSKCLRHVWSEAETRSTTAVVLDQARFRQESIRHATSAMALKIAGWGVKAKVVLDLLTIEPSGK